MLDTTYVFNVANMYESSKSCSFELADDGRYQCPKCNALLIKAECTTGFNAPETVVSFDVVPQMLSRYACNVSICWFEFY